MVTSLFLRLRFLICLIKFRLTDCLAGSCSFNQMSQYTFHYYWHDLKNILWSLLCWRRSRYAWLWHLHDHYLRCPKTAYILRKPIITGSQMLSYDWSTLSYGIQTMSESCPCRSRNRLMLTWQWSPSFFLLISRIFADMRKQNFRSLCQPYILWNPYWRHATTIAYFVTCVPLNGVCRKHRPCHGADTSTILKPIAFENYRPFDKR